MAVGHVSKVLLWALLLFTFAPPGLGQARKAARGTGHAPTTAGAAGVHRADVTSTPLTAGAQDVLTALAARAGVIFAGRVLEV